MVGLLTILANPRFHNYAKMTSLLLPKEGRKKEKKKKNIRCSLSPQIRDTFVQQLLMKTLYFKTYYFLTLARNAIMIYNDIKVMSY